MKIHSMYKHVYKVHKVFVGNSVYEVKSGGEGKRVE